VRPRAERYLDLEVSPACLDRAVRILDALLKALEARGYTVKVRDEGKWATQVRVLDEWISFRLREKVVRRERPPTDQERADARRYPNLYGNRKYYRDEPTGQLHLDILGSYDNLRSWKDGESSKLEDQLNRFIAGLVRRAEGVKRERIEAEEARKAWEEEERRRQERALRRQKEERRRQEEEARLRALEGEAQAWVRAQQLRAYLGAVRQAALERGSPVIPGSDLERWLTWANGCAGRLDPIDTRVGKPTPPTPSAASVSHPGSSESPRG
jgi:hypothetical protein